MRTRIRYLTILFLIVALVVVAGCSTNNQSEGEHNEGSERGEDSEHSEGSEHGEGGAEEESGQTLSLDDRYDAVRNVVQLTMAYDPTTTSFNGMVQNATDQTLCGVRVEVHLSNGTELGPTSPTDLAPGESIDVELSATEETFDGWSAHPETSACSSSGGG